MNHKLEHEIVWSDLMVYMYKARFPVLSLGIRTDINTAESIIVATAVLHNICNADSDNYAHSRANEVGINTDDFFDDDSPQDMRTNIIVNHFQRL